MAAPKDERARITLRLPPAMHARLKRIAQVRDKSVNDLICDWLTARLQSIPQERKHGANK